MMDLSEPEPDKRYSSMMDLSEVDRSKMRSYHVIHEDSETEPGLHDKHRMKHYRSEEYLVGHNNPSYASLKRIRSPDFIKSNESLSSGKKR